MGRRRNVEIFQQLRRPRGNMVGVNPTIIGLMVKFGNYTDKFKEGMQAYVDGKKTKDNPYTFDTPFWDDWKDGHAFCKAVAYAVLLINDADRENELIEKARVDSLDLVDQQIESVNK
jgi:hypothetical protein